MKLFKSPGNQDVLVQSVIEGLPVAKAGIGKGDIIVSINGESIKGSRDLRLKVSESAPSEEIDVEIYRMGKRMVIRVELADPENAYGRGRYMSLVG